MNQTFLSRASRWAFFIVLMAAFAAGFSAYTSNVLSASVIDPVWLTPFELFPIYWYGLVVLVAIGMGFWAAAIRPVADEQFSGKPIWRYVISIVFAGLVGARLFDVVFLSPIAMSQGITATSDYLGNSAWLLDFSWGGLNVWGALFGGGAMLFWVCWRTKISRGPLFFKAIIGFLIGLSVVQWGHFINQELYGYPWSGLGSIYIEPIHRIEMFTESERFVPLFLLAAIWYLAGGVWLLCGRRWQQSTIDQFDGTMVGLIWFIVGRLALELATPNSLFNWLPASILLTIILVTVLRRKKV